MMDRVDLIEKISMKVAEVNASKVAVNTKTAKVLFPGWDGKKKFFINGVSMRARAVKEFSYRELMEFTKDDGRAVVVIDDSLGDEEFTIVERQLRVLRTPLAISEYRLISPEVTKTNFSWWEAIKTAWKNFKAGGKITTLVHPASKELVQRWILVGTKIIPISEEKYKSYDIKRTGVEIIMAHSPDEDEMDVVVNETIKVG